MSLVTAWIVFLGNSEDEKTFSGKWEDKEGHSEQKSQHPLQSPMVSVIVTEIWLIGSGESHPQLKPKTEKENSYKMHHEYLQAKMA